MNDITIDYNSRGEIIDIQSVQVVGIKTIVHPNRMDSGDPPDQIALACELDNGDVKFLAVSLGNAYQIEQAIAQVRTLYPGLLESQE